MGVLQKMFSPRAIVERNEVASRKFEGLPDASGVVAGTLAGPVKVRLNGLSFEVDILAGHKTGLYLDQQVNYMRVASLLRLQPNARVLDCFSFLGGFALHAARAGAARVDGVDQSAEAVAAATRNAAANKLDAVCGFEAANVFDWLKARTTVPSNETLIPQYDMVIDRRTNQGLLQPIAPAQAAARPRGQPATRTDLPLPVGVLLPAKPSGIATREHRRRPHQRPSAPSAAHSPSFRRPSSCRRPSRPAQNSYH